MYAVSLWLGSEFDDGRQESHVFAREREGTLPGLPDAGNQTGNGIGGSTALALEERLTCSEFRFSYLVGGLRNVRPERKSGVRDGSRR